MRMSMTTDPEPSEVRPERIKTMAEHEVETDARGERFSARVLAIGVLCLLVVVLVMAFSLVYATTIAATAQDSAERQERLNDNLREELACRAKGVTEFDLAKGDVIAGLGDLVIHLGEDEEVAEAQAVIEKAVVALRAAAVARTDNLETCAAISLSNGG
jgi:hypothetical protein